MNVGLPSAPSAIGFVSMLACDSLGWVGGYLLVNPQGRPLEFHCTVPVAPSRAQQILYGATFDAFFFGELLTSALLKRGKTSPELVLTNHHGALAARELHQGPMLYLPMIDGATDATDAPDATSLAAHRDYSEDLNVGQKLLARLPGSWPLTEPFERIEQAVREAQRAA